MKRDQKPGFSPEPGFLLTWSGGDLFRLKLSVQCPLLTQSGHRRFGNARPNQLPFLSWHGIGMVTGLCLKADSDLAFPRHGEASIGL
jgi:hypothetical protein